MKTEGYGGRRIGLTGPSVLARPEINCPGILEVEDRGSNCLYEYSCQTSFINEKELFIVSCLYICVFFTSNNCNWDVKKKFSVKLI